MNVSSPPTDWLAAAAGSQPKAIALIEDDGARVSYAELSELADSAAERLGRAAGDKGGVSLVPIGDVDRNLVASLWGAWRRGVAPLVIDQSSPMLAEWGSTLRRMSDSGPTGTSDSPLHTVILTSGSGGEPRPVRLTAANVAKRQPPPQRLRQ